MTQRKGKERITVTVDRDVLEAAGMAVAAGHASSLSGWVNMALTERAAKEARLRALAAAVAAYEAEFGPISAAEIAAQERADRGSALVVRHRRDARTRKKNRRGRAA